jgi:hypothetical protein
MLEHFAGGLPREQSDERKERSIRLRIRIDRRVVLVRHDIRRSCRLPEIRSLSSTHDNPALTRNDELLSLNQLEAGRSVLRTERPFRADDADPVDAHRTAEPDDVRPRGQRPPARLASAPAARTSAGLAGVKSDATTSEPNRKLNRSNPESPNHVREGLLRSWRPIF